MVDLESFIDHDLLEKTRLLEFDPLVYCPSFYLRAEELFEVAYNPAHAQLLIKRLFDPRTFWTFAETDDELIGCVEVRTSIDRLVANFHSMVVHPEYRNKGLAQALCGNALESAKLRGFKYAIGHAVCTHTGSQAICESYGFTPLGFEPNRIKDPRDDAKFASLVLYGKTLVEHIVAPRPVTDHDNNLKFDSEFNKVRLTALHDDGGYIAQKFLHKTFKDYSGCYWEIEVPLSNSADMKIIDNFNHKGRFFSWIADIPYLSRPYVEIGGAVARFASSPKAFPEKTSLHLTAQAAIVYDKARQAHDFAGSYHEQRKMVHLCNNRTKFF